MVEFVSCNFWRSLKLPRRKFWHCHLLVEGRRWRRECCIYSISFIAHLHVRAAHGDERPPPGPEGLPGSKPASSSDHSWIEKCPQAKRNSTEGAKKAGRWRIVRNVGINKEMQQIKTKNVVGTLYKSDGSPVSISLPLIDEIRVGNILWCTTIDHCHSLQMVSCLDKIEKPHQIQRWILCFSVSPAQGWKSNCCCWYLPKCWCMHAHSSASFMCPPPLQ